MRTCSFSAIRISRISLTLCRYPACHILPPWIQLSGGFELRLQNFTLAVLPFRRIKKINLTSKLQLQTLHWYFGFTEISPFPPSKRCFRNTKRIYSSPKVHFRSTEGQTFYWSIYDSWWQHQCPCAHSGMTAQVGCFQNPVVFLQEFPYLSSPPLPALLLAPFLARSLTLVPRSLLENRTETLATQAVRNGTYFSERHPLIKVLIHTSCRRFSFCF